jgi:hypothetical protein
MNAYEARCDNCGRVHHIGDLAEPGGLHERLDPGGTVPSGVCPACGALAYPVDPAEKLVFRTMGANLNMRRIEFEVLLAHLKEGPGSTIRRRLEVLLGEKTLDEVDAEERHEGEPAYTVVGRYGDNDQTYITTVYTQEPSGVPALARRVCSEESEIPLAELDLDIVAIFEGECAVAARGDEAQL